MHVCIRVCMCVLLPPLTPAFILCLPLYQGAYIYELQHLTPLSCFWLGSAMGDEGRRRGCRGIYPPRCCPLNLAEVLTMTDFSKHLWTAHFHGSSIYGQLTFMAPAHTVSPLPFRPTGSSDSFPAVASF